MVALAPKVAAANGLDTPAGLRLTESFVQYDVSPDNPNCVRNMGKAIAGNIHDPRHTFHDPEKNVEMELGDVLVSVDLSDPKQIVLQHIETAGKGHLGRVLESAIYWTTNPLEGFGMKVLGTVKDPEVLYLQKVVQMLATLEQNGMFGPPGASTFNLDDWIIETRDAWRDVLIRLKKNEPKPEPPILQEISFSDTLRAAAALPFV